MEILNTYQDMGPFVVAMIFMVVITLFVGFLGASGVYEMVEHGVDGAVLTLTIVMFLAFVGCLFITLTGFEQGPTTYYEAKVTDFNEVYGQGYEIVDQEGEIYTLKKTEED